MTKLTQELLDYVSRPGYRPQRPRAISKNLGITKKRLADFEAALAELQKAGKLRISDSGRVQTPAPANAVIGTLRKIRSGAAFLIPHEPRPADLDGDVYIDASDLKDAQNGDEVLVKLTNRRRTGGGRNGIVVDVVERATNVFVGTYFEEDDEGWVEVDGDDFQDPVYVGDPGAKGRAGRQSRDRNDPVPDSPRGRRGGGHQGARATG
ncbi:MAG: hypothetical protein R3B90_11390 [Planctomycetaceae bacterium]